WEFTANGTQVEYNVHLVAGDDVGFIPPYMMVDLSTGEGLYLVQRYNLHVPVWGITFTGWNIGNYWTLYGMMVESKPGELFSSWNAYMFFFRNKGDFGAPPEGDTYRDLVKKTIYYRTKIVEDIWRAMESMGLYEQYWSSLATYLNAHVELWKAVRERLGWVYIP
ncbi:MAG: hypothetical protein ACXQS2_01460, partial [Methermicoccaceae archaeon]